MFETNSKWLLYVWYVGIAKIEIALGNGIAEKEIDTQKRKHLLLFGTNKEST